MSGTAPGKCVVAVHPRLSVSCSHSKTPLLPASMVKELKAELEGLNRCVRCAARTSSAVVVGGVRPARRVSLLRLRPVPSPSHKHAATGFRQDLEECRDKISGVEDKIQVLNDEIDREQAVGREAQDAITRIDDFQLQLEQKRSHMVTQEAG